MPLCLLPRPKCSSPAPFCSSGKGRKRDTPHPISSLSKSIFSRFPFAFFQTQGADPSASSPPSLHVIQKNQICHAHPLCRYNPNKEIRKILRWKTQRNSKHCHPPQNHRSDRVFKRQMLGKADRTKQTKMEEMQLPKRCCSALYCGDNGGIKRRVPMLIIKGVFPL